MSVRAPWFPSLEAKGWRWWLPYWTYHLLRRPHKAAPVFVRWARAANSQPRGEK